jgi:hypothetical protein
VETDTPMAEQLFRIRAKLDSWGTQVPEIMALRAVLDLCDAAPVNDDVGVMFADEIEHVIAVALGLPGDPRHV